MRSLFIIFILCLSSTAYSFSCEQNEAQFIGKVTQLREEIIDQAVRDCYVKIDFRYFNENILCPLDRMTAEFSEIKDYDCQRHLEAGQEVSGILIEKNGDLFIE